MAHTRYLKCSTATFKMLPFPNLNPDWMSTYYYIAALHHFVDRKIYTLPKANEQYDDYLAGRLITVDTSNINKQRLQATELFLVLGGDDMTSCLSVLSETQCIFCKRVYVS